MNLNIIMIKKQDFSLAPGQKVINAADYTVIEKSTKLVDQAREQARQIEEEAKKAYQQEKERGYQDGLMQSRLEQSEQMLKMVDRSISYLADVEASLADILMTAVNKIIEGYDDRALTVGLIKSGLQHVRNERQVTVRVPPSHYSYVKEQVADILSGYKGVGILNPVSDPRLKAGSCILESKIGVVDASIDIQMEALKKNFAKLTANSMDAVRKEEGAEWADNPHPVEESSVEPEVAEKKPQQDSQQGGESWFT
ncbi:HrpE/YscL family type III secretion apparatus protein [Sansalvadorimonas sp. 2012CJ34-2]|uniref:Type 3 secretion system stator protein n=1 Tax=Parendozoicomonas callyspongiae TaxID=2942213 RepID=A0ABT0PH30_9GAMM|nr:HrpE/YscL family type III secretion apparatus protein [Sansalvadorimonas sp. 2012CJ34-2]MCL6270556.1 HrpE/YscL family type III secretion apparatus protein [Sansalvadorimonas sp. 2012CJ34-2]